MKWAKASFFARALDSAEIWEIWVLRSISVMLTSVVGEQGQSEPPLADPGRVIAHGLPTIDPR
jgi:hypothetical protein